MTRNRKKRALTLLEIMIVIVLIGLIGSVIGVNMKGSLDEGRAFKTKQAQEQIADILMLEVARGSSVDEVVKNPAQFLENSGLVKKPADFLKDGWGNPFEIKTDEGTHSKVIVKSAKLKAFESKKKGKLGKADSDASGDDN